MIIFILDTHSFGQKSSASLGKLNFCVLRLLITLCPFYRKQIALWTQELGATSAIRAFRRAYPELGQRGGPTRKCCYYNLKRLLDTEDLSFENKVKFVVVTSVTVS